MRELLSGAVRSPSTEGGRAAGSATVAMSDPVLIRTFAPGSVHSSTKCSEKPVALGRVCRLKGKGFGVARSSRSRLSRAKSESWRREVPLMKSSLQAEEALEPFENRGHALHRVNVNERRKHVTVPKTHAASSVWIEIFENYFDCPIKTLPTSKTLRNDEPQQSPATTTSPATERPGWESQSKGTERLQRQRT